MVILLLAAAGCRQESGAPPQARRPAAPKVATRTVTLYFESPQMLLAPERREMSLPEVEASAAQRVVEGLVGGSANSTVPRLFPEDTVVRATYLLADGTAVVDLGGPTLAAGWNTGSHTEMMAVFSIVQTLTANFDSVKRVRIVVNGQPAQTLGGHIDIDRPLTPLPSLMATK